MKATALLQSYDGILRIAPSFPSKKTGRFTLYEVGDIVVFSGKHNLGLHG